MDAKLEELNVQSLVELKQLKISNTQTRIEAYQLSNFVSKIKKLFITSTGSKEELSLNELVKCVKSLLQEKSEATKSTVRKNCK